MANDTLQGWTLNEWGIQLYDSVLIAGMPKGAGKTTLAMTAIRPDDYAAVVLCDLGKLSGTSLVNPEHVLVLPNQTLTRELNGSGNSAPVKDVFLKLTGDLYKVYRSVKDQTAIKLQDGKEFPPPNVVILDGMSRLNTMLVDGQCALQNILDPSDLDNKAFKFWGKRLRNILTIVEQFASLPCTVVMTTWLDPVKTSDGTATGVWLPDIGGKMDVLTAGTVGAALHAFSRQGKFYVQTRSDGQYPWCGVRDRYGLAPEIDVTISAQNQVRPWQRIFSEIAK